MHRYVAFLRGINVGGRTVVKEKFTEIFTSAGFQNVSTFKQSGNVTFEAETSNSQRLKAEIEEKLHRSLGYEVAVFIRTIPQLKNIIDLEPFKQQPAEASSFLVTFLPSEPSSFPFQFPATIPKSMAQVITARSSEVFSVTHGGGEGALPNPFLESKLKVKATTRNINTLCEIVKKYG